MLKSTLNQSKHIESLEALRGISAISVLGTHVFGFHSFTDLLVLPASTASFLASLFPGHLGVLYFFVLSGFVIGCAHPFEINLEPLLYLGKRFIRIWPMYILCLLLASIANERIDVHSFLKSSVFLSTTYPMNNVLWSVCFEFFFYLTLPLLFLVPSFRNVKGVIAIGTLSLLVWFFVPVSIVSGDLRAWFLGLFIWSVGLYIAWTQHSFSVNAHSHSLTPNFIAWFMLGASFFNIGGGAMVTVFEKIGLKDLVPSFFGIIGLPDLIGLPLVLCGFFAITGRTMNNHLKLSLFYGYLSFVTFVLVLSVKIGVFFQVANYPASFLLALGAIITWFYKNSFSGIPIAPFVSLGGISYGVYIFHMPLMKIAEKLTTFLYEYNSLAQNILAVSITLASLFPLSWIVEKKLQPRLRDSFLSLYKK